MQGIKKGYLFAFLSALSLANVYIFSKAALNEVKLAQFGFYWFGFAILWNFIYTILSGNRKKLKRPTPFQVKNLIGIGIAETIATIAIFIGIQTIPNPTIPSLIRNLEPVIIVILSIFFLKEKYNTIEKLGLVTTILGTILIAYNKGNNLSDIFVKGVEYIILACIFYSIRTIWSKKVIKHHTPLSLNLNKISFLFITSIIALLFTNEGISINSKALVNILIGSLIGPFFTSIIQFSSLKYIDASKSTMIQSATGFITMILAYFYFGDIPYTYQIIGGIITILGLILVTKRGWKQGV